MVEEIDGKGDKGSGDTTIADVEILLEDFWNWDYFPHLPKCQNFQSISIRIKGILLLFAAIITSNSIQ
jgi:hypothetical protein